MDSDKKKWSLNICSFIFFSSFLILFKSPSGNFNENILRLVFAFVAFAATSGSVTDSFAPFGSVAGSFNGILFKFFIGNNLVLKLACTK